MTHHFAWSIRSALLTTALTSLALCAAACGDSTTTPPKDGGIDACHLECAAPPIGCRLEGGDGCTTCGTVVCPDAELPDGGADDAGTEDAGIDDAGDSDGGAAISCTGPGGSTFPTFDRACAGEGDCVVVEHQTNCCGTLRALGIRADQQAAFDAAEASCRAMYPGCGCASMATQADDDTIDDGSTPARVLCAAGQCTSTFAPEVTGCDPSSPTACGAGYSCCYPCGIPGCTYQCEPSCAAGTPGCAGGCIPRP